VALRTRETRSTDCIDSKPQRFSVSEVRLTRLLTNRYGHNVCCETIPTA